MGCVMRLVLTTASLFFALALGARTSAQRPVQTADLNQKHESDQWKLIEQHLADPTTATAEKLEMQADILRARKFPEDAIAYYQYAMAKGGSAPRLLNKIGLTDLELRNMALARVCFQRVTKLSKKDPEAWNNLGAVEYLNGDPARAISAYKKAIKLDKRGAVYHANLATAYFDRKDYESARREIGLAMSFDPGIFDRKATGGGVAAHVLSSEDRARFSYEMAKMYARAGLEDQMLHSLAMASEAGMDIQREMRKDARLAKLADDPRVLVMVKNAQALRASRGSGVPPAPLPADKPISE
jgi:Flp pilus assembly protein TadD